MGESKWQEAMSASHKKRTYIVAEKEGNKWKVVYNYGSIFHDATNMKKVSGLIDTMTFNHAGFSVVNGHYRVFLWHKDYDLNVVELTEALNRKLEPTPKKYRRPRGGKGRSKKNNQ